MKEYPNYYSITPATVRYDNRLKANEKLLFGEITALSNIKGYCYSTNKYFSKLYDVSITTISTWINHLKELGYIKVEMIKEGKEIKERHLFPVVDPIKEKLNTPIKEKFKRGIKENFKENNTSINNINKNMLGCYAIEFYEKNIGFVSPFIREDIEAEVRDWNQINPDESEQIIVEALKNAIGAQASNKWKYAKSILSSWQEKNIKSINDIKADDVEHRKKMESKYNRKNNNYGRKPIEEKMPYWYQHENKETNTNDSHENIDYAEIEKLMQKINDEEE